MVAQKKADSCRSGHEKEESQRSIPGKSSATIRVDITILVSIKAYSCQKEKLEAFWRLTPVCRHTQQEGRQLSLWLREGGEPKKYSR